MVDCTEEIGSCDTCCTLGGALDDDGRPEAGGISINSDNVDCTEEIVSCGALEVDGKETTDAAGGGDGASRDVSNGGQFEMSCRSI